MADYVRVPIKTIGADQWGMLSLLADSHLICGESVRQKQDFSFAGQHRVRLYSFKKNVAFKIPEGVQLDIAEVPAANAPRRPQR
jgi:hypothetical protein